MVAAEELGVLRRAFGCDDALAATIAALGKAEDFARGQQLYPLSDADLNTLLLAGQAVEIAYGRDGHAVVLCALGPGELFGGLLSGDADDSGAIVEAASAARGRRFAGATLLRLMDSYNCVAVAITRQLAARLAMMRRRMVESVLLSATGRVCAELERLAKASPDQTIRPVPVFSELATIVQSTRETVSRTISNLERRGVLSREDGGLRVVAPHRLTELIY